MRKPIPPHSLSLKLFPPVSPEDHVFLENALLHPFQPRPAQPRAHSPVNAWWLAELSLLAYNRPEIIESELRKARLELVKPVLNGTTTQGFIAESDSFLIVAFRGTEIFVPGKDSLASLRGAVVDSLADADSRLVRAPAPAQGQVHRGFLKALDEVFSQFGNLTAKGKPVWLTGHSLGGALAILAAARLPGIQGVYTFGAPSVGDGTFGSNPRVRPFRFVHGSDWVTRILGFTPFRAETFPFFGFYRTDGEVVAFDRDGRLRAGTPVTSFFRRATDLDLLDHSPLFYALHLWNLFDSGTS